MPSNFNYARILAAILLPIILPFFLKGQCAPDLDVILQRLILDYNTESNTPDNLDNIDVELDDDSMNGNYNVTEVFSTWQTVGNDDFSGIELTGAVTIHYDDLSTQVCEYVNGELFDPLPIELSVFNGHLIGNDVFLSWSTETEEDNAGFEIERSFDGDNFERIAFRNGAGDSEEKLWYSFEDPDVKNTALGKAVYYRLKQINYDQTYWYSHVVVVDLKIDIQGFEITKILGSNNPDRIVKVYFHNPVDIQKINIAAATINGQMIEQRSIYPQAGFNFFEIDLSYHKDNMFFISLNNGKQTTVEKLIFHSTK